jgi:SNF2 family DNA or RNA helicase
MSKARLYRLNKTELELIAPNDEGRERFSFDYDTTLKIRDLCKERGWRVSVEPRLKEWIKNETAKQNWEFDLIPPESPLGIALSHRSFQRDGVDFTTKHKNVLIADEPGLGKSLQAISSVIQSGTTGSVLIVAPKTAVFVTWPHELETWFNDVAPYEFTQIC